MPDCAGQVLTVAQMRGAEQGLIDAGTTVETLMRAAGHGAAEWVRRMAAGGPVTVLCGPGNNGGDGWVIAETLRAHGLDVVVVAPLEISGVAAKEMQHLYVGPVIGRDDVRRGEVLVDCLFGIGLSRPVEPGHAALIRRLADSHRLRVALDLPSGVHGDTGALLSDSLPHYDSTLALGAWKPAHLLMPAAAQMGERRLVPIGIEAVNGAAQVLAPPQLHAPAVDAHKYTRGLLTVIAGAMPGAALLSAHAAQGAGAGYVKLLDDMASGAAIPPDLVVDARSLADALHDPRITAMLIGPGLGRNEAAHARLRTALTQAAPLVIDADALMLLESTDMSARTSATIATPHDGEFKHLERAFGTPGIGAKSERAQLLAQHSGMVIVAKGPDTVIAAPDGRVTFAGQASSWLSTAGTGDVLAGTIASRVATGVSAFDAACEGVWLHAEAARSARPPFSAGLLAEKIRTAFAACL